MVNSPAFAPVQKVTRLSQAATMIGMKNLMPLVFGLSLGGTFNKLALRAEDREALFQSALLKGCAARAVAAITAKDQLEEAFLCGLLQDVAIPAILASDRSALEATTRTLDLPDPLERLACEEQAYCTNHAELGKLIVTKLALPGLFSDAVALHHAGLDALSASVGRGLARAVDIAASLPHRLTTASTAVQSVSMKLKSAVGGADTAAAEALAQAITDSYLATSRAFSDTDESGGAFRLFLQQISAEVARTTEEAVEASQSTIVDLETKRTQLSKEVDELRQHVARSELDGLTGIFNRAAFLRRVTLLLQAAREKGIECHIGYADIDNFKSVNDTHGHAIGDEAIREVANRLSTIIKGRGIAARMGGDEFAFVLVRRPGERPLNDETRLLSERLASFTLDIPGGGVPIGTSSGLFSFGVPKAGDTTESILARADALMYQVKRSGKGRCVTLSASQADFPVPTQGAA